MDKLSESEFAWATVYSENPLTVRRDGETEPIGITPQAIVPLSLLKTGNRVWCQFVNRRAIILGRATGVWPIFWGGKVNMSGIESGKGLNTTVTLPNGVFAEVQNVIATSESPRATVGIDNVSASSFDLRVYNWTSAATQNANVRWTVIGR